MVAYVFPYDLVSFACTCQRLYDICQNDLMRHKGYHGSYQTLDLFGSCALYSDGNLVPWTEDVHRPPPKRLMEFVIAQDRCMHTQHLTIPYFGRRSILTGLKTFVDLFAAQSQITCLAELEAFPVFGSQLNGILGHFLVLSLERFPNLKSVELSRHSAHLTAKMISRLLTQGDQFRYKPLQMLQSVHIDHTEPSQAILDNVAVFLALPNLVKYWEGGATTRDSQLPKWPFHHRGSKLEEIRLRLV